MLMAKTVGIMNMPSALKSPPRIAAPIAITMFGTKLKRNIRSAAIIEASTGQRSRHIINVAPLPIPDSDIRKHEPMPRTIPTTNAIESLWCIKRILRPQSRLDTERWLQLQRAISIHAEGKKLLQKNAIATSAARALFGASRIRQHGSESCGLFFRHGL